MRLLSPRVHRVLDFVTVVAFALAPSLLHFGGPAAMLSYVLAAVHLALTLLTQTGSGGRKPVALPVHGGIELLVGIALVILPFGLGWQGVARAFYLGAGGVILVVWLLSAYDARGGSGSEAR